METIFIFLSILLGFIAIVFLFMNLSLLRSNRKLISIAKEALEEGKSTQKILVDQSDMHRKLYIKYLLSSIEKAEEEEDYEYCKKLKTILDKFIETEKNKNGERNR
jgi:hypothetical protein